MNEIPPEMLLESEHGKIKVEEGCWRWVARDFTFYGWLTPAEVLYGCARGLVGRGLMLSKCARNEWCVNPWHRIQQHIGDGTCKNGHPRVKGQRCNPCARDRMIKYRQLQKQNPNRPKAVRVAKPEISPDRMDELVRQALDRVQHGID